MTATRLVGLILVIGGLVAVLWGGIFWTRNKKVIDAGPLQVKTQQHEGVAIPPIVGGAALIAGIALLVASSRRRV